jgi:hypothetical protein
MRWTRAALLTRALCWRTEKSCGPDASTLASSWREVSADDGDKKARSPGRSRRKPLKPLRREGRTASAEPVCSCALFCTFLHARPRVQRAPGFPCALFCEEGGKKRKNLARKHAARSRSHARYLPSLHAPLRVAGRGRGWGVYQLASLAASLPRHPPPPTPKSELRSSRPHRFAGGGERTKHSALYPRGEMDCFAEPVIGRAFARPVGSQ